MQPHEQTELMTLGELRHLVRGRAIRRATLIQQAAGDFHALIDIGPETVRLATARGRRPRPFRTLDGAVATIQALGLSHFAVDLTHHRGSPTGQRHDHQP